MRLVFQQSMGVGGLRAIGMVVSYTAAIVLARTLGIEAYGVYVSIVALVTMLSVPNQLGIPQLVVRRISISSSGGGLLLRKASYAILASTIILGAILAVVIVQVWGISDIGTSLLASMIMLFAALASIRSAALRGLRYPISGFAPDAAFRPTVFLLSLITTSAVGMLGSYQVALGLYLISAAAGLVLSYSLLHVKAPLAWNEKTDIEWLKLLPEALRQGMTHGSQALNKNIDVMLIATIIGPTEAGAYRLAWMTAMMLGIVLQSISQVISPLVAKGHKLGDTSFIQENVSLAVRIAFPFSLLALSLFLFFGTGFVSLLFGAGFAAASAPLIVLLVGNSAIGYFGLGSLVLTMGSDQATAAKIALLSLIGNICLNLLLVPALGITGAALATAASSLAAAIATWQVALTNYGVDTSFRVFPRR